MSQEDDGWWHLDGFIIGKVAAGRANVCFTSFSASFTLFLYLGSGQTIFTAYSRAVSVRVLRAVDLCFRYEILDFNST